MVEDRNLELILLGLVVGAVAAYFVMTINNQLQLLNQQLSTYNQYALMQQYQYPQFIQPQIQQVSQPKPIPKRLYNVQFDNEGFISTLNSTD